jgi:hypothetical protein
LATQKMKYSALIEDESKFAEERKKKLTVKEANRRKFLLTKDEEGLDYDKAHTIMMKGITAEELAEPIPPPKDYAPPYAKSGNQAAPKPAKLT